MNHLQAQRLNKAWEVVRTLVYAIGFTGACYIAFVWNWNTWQYSRWLGEQDLAAFAFWTMIGTWLVWNIGVGAILIDGMKKVESCEKHK